MKTASPWMPEAADESAIIEVMREMLEGDFQISSRDGGFRISVVQKPAEIAGRHTPR